jgi:hypothetical protein
MGEKLQKKKQIYSGIEALGQLIDESPEMRDLILEAMNDVETSKSHYVERLEQYFDSKCLTPSQQDLLKKETHSSLLSAMKGREHLLLGDE